MTARASTQKTHAGGVLDPLARLWLARATRAVMRVARRSPRGKSNLWIDDDVSDELGLAPYDSARFESRFRAVEALIVRLERQRPQRTGAAHVIADLVGGPLGLSLVERDAIALGLLHWHEAVFSDLLQEHVRTVARFARIAGPILGVSADTLLLALDGNGALARCHLVKCDGFRDDGALTLHAGLKTLLRRPPRTADDAMRAFVEPGKPSALALADVNHLTRDVELAVALLRGALAKRTRGVNILFYGPPGTGKTETARLVAEQAGAVLREVPVATHNAEKLGAARLGSYAFCQSLLAGAPRSAVLFDEVEDVLTRSSFAALWGVAETREDKGLFVRTLEENPVPSLWTSNHVDHIDPAILRRFDLVVPMRVPPERARRRAVDQHLGALSETARRALAGDDRLVPAVVERAARVMAVADLGADAGVEAHVARLVDNTLKVVAGPRRSHGGASPLVYDPAFANASVDLERVARAISAGRGLRLCLHGPPGTGKTAFMRHVAERAGRRLVAKRMSELLSKWVGGTEQAIAAMFDEARDDDAVLFLDEADGLLRERSSAEHSWEATQTNELLVQMEAFDGVFACATNLVDALDHAAFRRFDLKVQFEPLTRAQRHTLFERLAPLDDKAARRLDRLDGLCPGHYAAVARRVTLMSPLLTPTAADEIVAALEDEHRFVRARAPIGFGAQA